MHSYHGTHKRRGYFEGWYFKQQTKAETIALIPALHIDKNGGRSASIQVVMGNVSACAEFPYTEFDPQKRGLSIALGKNYFSARGLSMDLSAPDIRLRGELSFSPLTPPRYDIMGPFSFVPGLQCRHSVFSIAHRVNGSLLINGRSLYFDGTPGYIEGDRGHSFPKRYIWTQCSRIEREQVCSIMLSVADIPFFPARFTGVIGFVYFGGKEYRIATYLGARLHEAKDSSVTVRQRELTLQCQLLERHAALLRAPVDGSMVRRIRENPACRARYRFWKNGALLFDFVSSQAGFEWEYGDE